MKLIVFAPVGATLALLFAAYYTYTVFKIDEGTDKMKYIANSIRKGANACLLYTSPSPRDRSVSRMPSSA